MVEIDVTREELERLFSLLRDDVIVRIRVTVTPDNEE